jgi:hypothetical protein
MFRAGSPRGAPPYLIGNHVIAERMYRHDLEVMLNVPPRTVIDADNAGRAKGSPPASRAPPPPAVATR